MFTHWAISLTRNKHWCIQCTMSCMYRMHKIRNPCRSATSTVSTNFEDSDLRWMHWQEKVYHPEVILCTCVHKWSHVALWSLIKQVHVQSSSRSKLIRRFGEYMLLLACVICLMLWNSSLPFLAFINGRTPDRPDRTQYCRRRKKCDTIVQQFSNCYPNMNRLYVHLPLAFTVNYIHCGFINKNGS